MGTKKAAGVRDVLPGQGRRPPTLRELYVLALKLAFVALVLLPLLVAGVVAVVGGSLAGLLGTAAAVGSWMTTWLLGPEASLLSKLVLFLVALPLFSLAALVLFLVIMHHLAPVLVCRTTTTVTSEVMTHGPDRLIDGVCGNGTAAAFEDPALLPRVALAASHRLSGRTPALDDKPKAE